jgi:hypothetical protein
MKTIIFFTLGFLFFTKVIAQQTQTVRGSIRDEVSGAPIPGATIRLVSDRSKGEVTATDGAFRFAGVPLGRQSFEVASLGYQTVVIEDVIVTAGKELVLEILLLESIQQLSEAKINYDRNRDNQATNNEMLAVSARAFSMDETKRYAGSLGDPARMAANFPGVVSSNDTRNDIIIRGNSPNSMLWQLEGLNIPNPSHFGSLNSTGGSVSMLNNNLIAKSDFITGAFPAQYGNATSGVFDVRLRDGNNEKHEFLAQMGFNGFEAGAEGPVTKSNKATYLINARYSTLAAFQSLGLRFGTGGATPEYIDVNYKISTPVNRNGKLSVFGIWGQSRIDILASEYDSTGQVYGNSYSNRFPRYATNITGLTYNHQLSKNTSAQLILGYSRTNEQFDRDSVSSTDPAIATPDWHWKFVTGKYSGVMKIAHKFNARHSIAAGVSHDFTSYSIFNKRIYDGHIDRILANRKGSLGLTQLYMQYKFRLNERLSLIPGLHYQYLGISSSHNLEPRIAVKYAPAPTHTLGLAYGLHSQVENLITYAVSTPSPAGPKFTNETLGFAKSNHFVLSHSWAVTNNTFIKTEIYYQSLFDTPVERRQTSFSTVNLGAETIPTVRDSLVNAGTGRNYGIELTVERSFFKGFYYLLTTSFFDSKYRGSDGILRNTAFNMRNVVNLLGGKEWKIGKAGSVLGASIKVSRIGGRYLSPVDYAASTMEGEIQFDETRAYSVRQSGYFRTDLKISFRKEYRRSTLELSIDLQNLTDNQNLFRQDWNARELKVTDNYQQGFFPIPFVRFTF